MHTPHITGVLPGCVLDFFLYSSVCMLSTSLAQKSETYKREIHFFRSRNPLPRAQNFKPEFEFQTLLARNYPVGTSELLPLGANLDLTWDWIFQEISLRDYS